MTKALPARYYELLFATPKNFLNQVQSLKQLKKEQKEKEKASKTEGSKSKGRDADGGVDVAVNATFGVSYSGCRPINYVNKLSVQNQVLDEFENYNNVDFYH